MRRRRAERWLLHTLLLLAAVDAAVYFGFVQPRRSRPFDETVAAALQVQVEQAGGEVARLARIERDLPTATEQLDKFVTQYFLAEQAGFSVLVSELERAATEVGVSPGRIEFRRSAMAERPELLRVEIATTVEGSYVNLLRFLEALERSKNFFLLERLALASATPEGKLKLDLTLATYLRRGRP